MASNSNASWFTKPAWTIVLIGSAIFAYLAFRSMGLQPVVMSDEQEFNTYSRILDPSQANNPSYLFYSIFRLTNYCGTGFLECGRLLNIALLALSSIPFYLICKDYLPKRTSAYITLITPLAAWGYYVTYFMPEILYYLIFCITAWVIVSDTQYSKEWFHSCLSGAMLGVLSLVKPHAFFLIPAYLAFRIYSHIIDPRGLSWKRLVGLVTGTIVIMFFVRFAGGYMIAGHAGTDLIGDKYASVANRATRTNYYMQALIGIWHVAKGHIYGLLVLFAEPLVMGIVIISEKGNNQATTAKKVVFLAGAVLICMIGVTAAYTMQVNGMNKYESMQRLHMRYYFFLFPIFCSIGAVFCNKQNLRLRSWHRALVACTIIATIYAGFRGLNNYVPFTVDAPDLAIIACNPIYLHFFTLLQTLILTLLFIRPSTASKVFTYIFIPGLIIRAALIFPSFYSQYRTLDAADRAGIFYNMTIGSQGSVVVIGDDASEVTRVVFHLNNKDIQRQFLPATATITFQQIAPRTQWIIALNNNPLDPSLQGKLAYDMPGYKIWHVGTSDFTVDFHELDWPGIESITGISVPEGFGRWSDEKQVVVRFKQDIPRNIALTITAAAFARNVDKNFLVQIGGQVKTLKLGKDPTATNLIYNDLPANTHEIVITVPEPISPRDSGLSADPRELGIALSQITLTPIIPR